MNKPLMSKATAVWLIENTTLSFQQIAEFCQLHELEIQGIADGDVAAGMQGYDPIDNKQLTKEEILRCEKDPEAKLELLKSNLLDSLPPRNKDTKYTPISLRQDKPYAILWLIKRYPEELVDSQIARLTGSTKNTVHAIRNGIYREAVLETKSPMDIGLCSYMDLEKALNRAKNKMDKEKENLNKEASEVIEE